MVKKKSLVFVVCFFVMLNAGVAVSDEGQMPQIVVEQPKENSTVNTASVSVHGRVSAAHGKAITALLINDEPYPVSLAPEAGFYRKVKLQEGENKVVLVAEDTEGALSRKVLTVIYDKNAEKKEAQKPMVKVETQKKDEIKKDAGKKITKFVASIGSVTKNKVIFYAGKADGLAVGDVVAIKRGKDIIGKIKVIEVSATKSTGTVMEMDEGMTVNEDDVIVPFYFSQS